MLGVRRYGVALEIMDLNLHLTTKCWHIIVTAGKVQVKWQRRLHLHSPNFAS